MSKKKKNQPGDGLDPNAVHFIPLGGSEQFGVNLNLYAYHGKWLAVDCGIGFADHSCPGVDILLPDPQFIEERRDDLVGLVITHAHEDHIGAVPHLWPRLRCPIYCSAFTATILRKKFDEYPDCKNAEIHVIRPNDKLVLEPFNLEFVHMAHSIPNSLSMLVETAAGRVFHSGDWNLDETPVIGKPTDEAALKKIGDKGIMAYIGDSTNADLPGRAGSEADVEKGLADLIAEQNGRVAVTIFASNIGRMRSICKAAEANGRSVCVIGRSLHTMMGAAKANGYLDDIPDLLDAHDMDGLPRDQQLYIVTGSQGEARAALARISKGERREVKLARGDTVIFSARPIPGNEKEINEVKNNLVAGGVRVIGPRETQHKIHVSGHPYQDELAEMYKMIRPKTVIPVHGERMQLEAQANFARACQIGNVVVPVNGAVMRITEGGVDIIDHVPTGVLAVEPQRIVPTDHGALAERRKLQYTGAVHASLVLNRRGDLMSDPQVSTLGLLDEEFEGESEFLDDLHGEIEDILADMERGDRADDHAVHEEIRIGLRRYVQNALGIKPKATVHVVRLDQ